MDSVREHLYTPHGLVILDPPFASYDPAIGSVGVVPPGFKENGGIFCHANAWAVIAECILGRGDRAFEYHRTYSPYTKNEISEVYRAEPYAYAQAMVGKNHPEMGRARNSWQSGTVPWAFIGISQHILGIKPTYEGLAISPCIPSAWDGYRVDRRFRGAAYEIKVRNPQHVCTGVKELRVDEELIEGNVVPVLDDGRSHRVEVVMG